MTYEQTRDFIKEAYIILGRQNGKRCTLSHMSNCIDAIEKQIPKSIQEDKYKRIQCCNGHNIPTVCKDGKMPYCPFCGQRLDFTEEDEKK